MALTKGGSGAANLAGASNLTRFQEWRSRLEHSPVDGTANSLNAVSADLATESQVWRPLVGPGPLSFRADNRTCWDLATAGGAGSINLAGRPYFNGINSVGWADVLPAITGQPGNVNAGRAPSVTISAWMRKKTAIEATHARRTFGFGNNVVTAPSAAVPRCGLIGDGAVGFRFGSVNCPDGAAAGENAATDIDAGSVQPAELANPGLAWFHVAIKLVPPGVGEPGKWIAFLNGRPIQVFDLAQNLPRGAGAVAGTRSFSPVEPTVYGFSDAVAIIPTSFLVWALRLRIADEWTATLFQGS